MYYKLHLPLQVILNSTYGNFQLHFDSEGFPELGGWFQMRATFSLSVCPPYNILPPHNKLMSSLQMVLSSAFPNLQLHTLTSKADLIANNLPLCVFPAQEDLPIYNKLPSPLQRILGSITVGSCELQGGYDMWGIFHLSVFLPCNDPCLYNKLPSPLQMVLDSVYRNLLLHIVSKGSNECIFSLKKHAHIQQASLSSASG